MWLDYKGKRHFLPTEMPEEPEKETFSFSWPEILLFLLKQILIPLPKILLAHLIGIGQSRIVEILFFQPDHKAPGNLVMDGIDIHPAHLRLAGLRIGDIGEIKRYRLIVLNGDHSARIPPQHKAELKALRR